MIRNVVFDLGGVILGHSYEKNKEAMDAVSFMKGDQPFPWWWVDFDRGTITWEGVMEEIAKETGCTLGEADGMIRTVMHSFDEFPDSVELVRELSGRGYKLYILSNMPREFMEHMRTLGFYGYFDGEGVSSEENLVKPEPEFFRVLLDRYGLDPAETLFVDDKPSNTESAEKLGFRVCVFDHKTGPEKVRRILGGENPG